MGDFGDFEEVKDETKKDSQEQPQKQFPSRVKLPRDGEVIGKVMQRLGGNRMSIKATDGKTRNCRVPGRFRRRFWLREGHFVIIQPWEDDDEKGDIIYQYRPHEIIQLKKRGIVDQLKDEF